jgi:hypothetical protein
MNQGGMVLYHLFYLLGVLYYGNGFVVEKYCLLSTKDKMASTIEQT